MCMRAFWFEQELKWPLPLCRSHCRRWQDHCAGIEPACCAHLTHAASAHCTRTTRAGSLGACAPMNRMREPTRDRHPQSRRLSLVSGPASRCRTASDLTAGTHNALAKSHLRTTEPGCRRHRQDIAQQPPSLETFDVNWSSYPFSRLRQ